MKRVLWLPVLAAILLGSRAAEAAEPAAMITDVKGPVEVEVGGKWEGARLLEQLPEGTRLKLGKGGTATVSHFSDGKRTALTGPSQVKVGRQEVTLVEGAAGSVKVQAARKTARGKTMKPVGITMGGEFHRGTGVFQLLTLGGLLDPVLSWGTNPKATRYALQVNEPSGKRLWQTETRETRVKLPPECKLEPLARYELSVTALDEDLGTEVGAPLLGTFWVVSEETRQELADLREAAEAELRESPRDPTPLLILASQYYEAGLYAEALQLAERVLGDRPAEPGIHRFIASVHLKLDDYRPK